MRAIMGTYLRPTDLNEALRAMSAGGLTVLAGGTDYFPARVERPATEDVLDITGLSELGGIEDRGGHYRIGALTTWSGIIDAGLPRWFDGLKAAGREVGGRQIQNTGTIVGNVCNASPAADGIPALLALDASVELSSSRGRRLLKIDEFVLGNRKTARAADELATALIVPKPGRECRAVFLKLGARKYLVISIVMVAAVLEFDRGLVAAARIAVGACSAVARRLADFEHALIGAPLDDLASRVRAEHLSVLAPIDDIRAGAAYRRDAALTLVRRAVEVAGRECRR